MHARRIVTRLSDKLLNMSMRFTCMGAGTNRTGATGSRFGTPAPRTASRPRREPQTRFGWYLRGLMDRRGYGSDGELEADSGVAASLISRYQSGEAIPTAQHLRLLAPCLGVRLGDLLVAAELATPAELGMVTSEDVPSDLDPAICDAYRHLADPGLPDSAKDYLRTTLHGAMVYWHEQLDRPDPTPRRRPSPRPVDIART